jgi:SPX domain protein involved in polyphosphate accumulation
VKRLGDSYLSNLNRYELKYIIPIELVEPISEYIKPYNTLDKHSQISPDGFYTINSLYFDTPNYTFLKNRLYTKSPRFNMRGRSYGENPVSPYFLEIKYKDGNSVKKYRSKVDEVEWHQMFSDPEYRAESIDVNKELFYKTALKYNASPKIFTQYRRKAFVSDIDEYARVTMDINLQAYLEDSYNLHPDLARLTPYDSSNIFGKEPDRVTGESVILELKCYTDRVPFWMLDLIREFQLSRTSFSKYAKSLLAITVDNKHSIFDRL